MRTFRSPDAKVLDVLAGEIKSIEASIVDSQRAIAEFQLDIDSSTTRIAVLEARAIELRAAMQALEQAGFERTPAEAPPEREPSIAEERTFYDAPPQHLMVDP